MILSPLIFFYIQCIMSHSLLHKSGISYISSQKALKYSMAKNRRFLHFSFFTHLVSTQEIESAVESFFCGKERVVESRAIFFSLSHMV